MLKSTQQKSIAWYIDNFTPLTDPFVESIQNGLFVTADNGTTFSRSDGDLVASFTGVSIAGVSNGNADIGSYPRISANSKYTFEIMIGGSGTLTSGNYNIRFFDSSNTLISTLTGSFTPGGAKKQVTRTFVTPINAYYYEIDFLVGGTASSVVRFNNFLLYEGDYLFGGFSNQESIDTFPYGLLLDQYSYRATSLTGSPQPSILQLKILKSLFEDSFLFFRQSQDLVMDAESSAFSGSTNVISGGLVNSNIVLVGSSIAYADTRVQTDFGLRFNQLEDRLSRRYESTILDDNIDKGLILRIWFNTSKISVGCLFANQGFAGKIEALLVAGRLRFRIAEVDRNNAGGVLTDGSPIVANTWQMVTFSFKPNNPASFDPINDLDIFVNGVNQAVSLSNNGTPPAVITSAGTNSISIATRPDANANLLGNFDLVEIIKGKWTNQATETQIFNQRAALFGL